LAVPTANEYLLELSITASLQKKNTYTVGGEVQPDPEGAEDDVNCWLHQKPVLRDVRIPFVNRKINACKRLNKTIGLKNRQS
jgi:hypothetical protein